MAQPLNESADKKFILHLKEGEFRLLEKIRLNI